MAAALPLLDDDDGGGAQYWEIWKMSTAQAMLLNSMSASAIW